MKHIVFLACSLCFLFLLGCSADQSASTDTAGIRTDAAAETLANASASASTKAIGKDKDGFVPLKENETIQGEFVADLGNGAIAFRSLATRISDDFGQETERKLATTQSQQKLAEANARVQDSGISVQSSDISELAHAVAGRTISNSSVMEMRRFGWLLVELKGTSANDAELMITMTFNNQTLELIPSDSRIKFRPEGNSVFDTYTSDDVTLSLDHFTRNDDGSFSIKGSFNAKGMKSEEAAAKGPSSAEGHFNFTALPFSEL